ncbi:MAG: nucleotide sugar dehydrogenase [Bacteroidota bacterium]
MELEPKVRVAPDEELRLKLQSKTARIGVVGLGYVGLPLAFEFAKQGFDTLGIDLDTTRVVQLNAGQNFIQDLSDEAVRSVVEDGYLRAEDHFRSVPDLDVIFVCVPTPVTVSKDPDTSYIEAASASIASNLRAGHLVILKSTTYPETTEGVVQPMLEAAACPKGLQIGKDFFLAFSPERIDPGNQHFTTANTPVVVGGVTPLCTSLAGQALHQVVANVHPVSSPRVAEMEKLLENIFRSVNIALVNELARLCDRMGGVSIWEVVEAAATKPFGFMPFWPGPGLGGHCIPVDPYYLSWLARRYDFETSFITLAARVNEEMPFYVVEAVTRAVADQPVRLRDANILILGVAFKKNVDDTRHSPALRVIELLYERGIRNVTYSDPYVADLVAHVQGKPLSLSSVALTKETIRASDVVIVLTDHDSLPYAHIAQHARCIIDTRNAMSRVEHDANKVILLGGGNFYESGGEA